MPSHSTASAEPSAPEDPSSPSSSSCLEEGQALLARWVEAVESLNPDQAVALYAERGIAFWGTFGDYCRTTRAEARTYFERFLAADALTCSLGEAHWHAVGPQAVLVSGIYTFQIARDGQPATASRARFSFAFEEIDGDWKIVSHHSSLFPAVGY